MLSPCGPPPTPGGWRARRRCRARRPRAGRCAARPQSAPPSQSPRLAAPAHMVAPLKRHVCIHGYTCILHANHRLAYLCAGCCAAIPGAASCWRSPAEKQVCPAAAAALQRKGTRGGQGRTAHGARVPNPSVWLCAMQMCDRRRKQLSRIPLNASLVAGFYLQRCLRCWRRTSMSLPKAPMAEQKMGNDGGGPGCDTVMTCQYAWACKRWETACFKSISTSLSCVDHKPILCLSAQCWRQSAAYMRTALYRAELNLCDPLHSFYHIACAAQVA